MPHALLLRLAYSHTSGSSKVNADSDIRRLEQRSAPVPRFQEINLWSNTSLRSEIHGTKGVLRAELMLGNKSYERRLNDSGGCEPEKCTYSW